MLGISNVVRFDFPSPPPAQSLSRSLELLLALGAIDEKCELTGDIGERLSELPLHPFLARMLLASIEYECVKEVLSLVALLSVRTIFTIPGIGLFSLREYNVFNTYGLELSCSGFSTISQFLKRILTGHVKSKNSCDFE